MPVKRNYVRIAERVLGRSLPEGAVVHHVDQNRDNNLNNNLVILQNQQEHMALHRRLRILKAGGDPWKQGLCATCKHLIPLEDFIVRKGRRGTECRKCCAARSHKIWCRKTGREDRYETPEEFSKRQSAAALSRWRSDDACVR